MDFFKQAFNRPAPKATAPSANLVQTYDQFQQYVKFGSTCCPYKETLKRIIKVPGGN